MMDARSESCLAHVEPDLAKVIRAASVHSPVPFIVIHGIRTLAEERTNVAIGASQTLHSRHLPDKHGLSCAVDIAAFPDGHVSWDVKLYGEIAVVVKAQAEALKVPVEWGGDWHSLKDYGHFQLPWARYP